MLQWVRERGCPWEKETLGYAAALKQEQMLRWAMENGCPNFSSADEAEEFLANVDEEIDWDEAETDGVDVPTVLAALGLT